VDRGTHPGRTLRGPSGRKSGDLDLARLQTPFLSQYLELFSSDWPSCLARGLIGFPEGLANFSRQHGQANALVRPAILLRRAGPGGGLGAFPASPANSMASATAGSPQRSSKNPLIVSPQQVGCRIRPFAEGTRIASRSAWLMGDGTELLTCASGRSFHSAKTGLPFLSLTLLFFDDLKKDRICSAELKW
jgi:hypothetical protein